jgi:multimeric flavodoxin WrbA
MTWKPAAETVFDTVGSHSTFILKVFWMPGLPSAIPARERFDTAVRILKDPRWEAHVNFLREGTAMTTVTVVFQSGQGHTKALADAILKGVNSVESVRGQGARILPQNIREGRFKDDSLMAELDRSDGIVFGCATYMGSGSAVFKAFLEAAFLPHWLEQRWKGRFYEFRVAKRGQARHAAATHGLCHADGHDLGGGRRSAGQQLERRGADGLIDWARGSARWDRATPMKESPASATSTPRRGSGAGWP